MVRRNPKLHYGLLAIVLSVGLIAALHYHWQLGFGWCYLAATNVVTAFFYSYDKAAARYAAGRVPEVVLHLLCAAGGTPAAFAYSYLLRHKTRKSSFVTVRWLIVFVQLTCVAVYIYWF